jgi:hypothetical protein
MSAKWLNPDFQGTIALGEKPNCASWRGRFEYCEATGSAGK